MAEYRLDELARISDVSARNIRAYRERGLLDPPRRVGRSAFYDDYHLSQLRTINQLLRRGFNSAHIAEFFASMRQGADLADILGIQRAVLGPHADDTSEGARAAEGLSQPTARTPRRHHGPSASIPAVTRRPGWSNTGWPKCVTATSSWSIPTIAEILARTSDQLLYVRALLHIYEATKDAVDGLAGGFVQALEESVAARFGKDYVPEGEEIDELGQIVAGLSRSVGLRRVGQLDKSLQRQMTSAVSGYTAGILLERTLATEDATHPVAQSTLALQPGCGRVTAEALGQPHRNDRDDRSARRRPR